MARAIEPLVPEEPPPDVEPDRTRRADGLVQLLANFGDYEGLFGHLTEWEAMLQEAEQRGFISESLALQVDPPCQAGFVELAGGPGPVASLKTDIVAALSFDQATAFLDPARWPGCTDLWCSMDAQPGGPPRRYLEVIGLDCENPSGWTLRTYLEFENRTLPGIGVAVADYRLAADQTGADRLVEVDEGSITVINEVTRVRIVTVKLLRFRGLALQGGGHGRPDVRARLRGGRRGDGVLLRLGRLSGHALGPGDSDDARHRRSVRQAVERDPRSDGRLYERERRGDAGLGQRRGPGRVLGGAPGPGRDPDVAPAAAGHHAALARSCSTRASAVAPDGNARSGSVVSLPVSFENIPKQCTFRVARGAAHRTVRPHDLRR